MIGHWSMLVEFRLRWFVRWELLRWQVGLLLTRLIVRLLLTRLIVRLLLTRLIVRLLLTNWWLSANFRIAILIHLSVDSRSLKHMNRRINGQTEFSWLYSLCCVVTTLASSLKFCGTLDGWVNGAWGVEMLGWSMVFAVLDSGGKFTKNSLGSGKSFGADETDTFVTCWIWSTCGSPVNPGWATFGWLIFIASNAWTGTLGACIGWERSTETGIRCKYPYPMSHPRHPSPPHWSFGTNVTSRTLSYSTL